MAHFTANTLFLLLVTPIFMSRLGAESYGVWILATDLLGFLTVADAGFKAAVVKFVAEYEAKDDVMAISQVLTAVLSFFVVAGAVVGLSVIVFTPILVELFGVSDALRSQARFAFRMSAVSLIPNLIRRNLVGVPMAKLRYGWATALRLGWTIVSMGGVVLVVGTGGDLADAMTWMAVATWGTALITGYVVWRLLNRNAISVVWSWTKFKEVFHFSFFSALAAFGTTLFSRVDRLVVGVLLGPIAAGFYGIATNIASKVNIMAGSMTHVLMPAVSAMNALDATRIYPIFRRASRIVATLVLGVTTVLFVVANWGLRVWLGDTASSELVSLVRVTLVAYGLLSLNVTAYFSVNGLGHPEINALGALCGSLIVLGLDIVLLPRIGLIGAGLANFGYFVIFVAFVYIHLRCRRPLFRGLWETLGLPVIGMVLLTAAYVVYEDRIGPLNSLMFAAIVALGFTVMALFQEQSLIKRWGKDIGRWISTIKAKCGPF